MEKIEGKITDKDFTIYKGESGCTIDFENRILHIVKFKIISNNRYQIIGRDTAKTDCAGQS